MQKNKTLKDRVSDIIKRVDTPAFAGGLCGIILISTLLVISVLSGEPVKPNITQPIVTTYSTNTTTTPHTNSNTTKSVVSKATTSATQHTTQPMSTTESMTMTTVPSVVTTAPTPVATAVVNVTEAPKTEPIPIETTPAPVEETTTEVTTTGTMTETTTDSTITDTTTDVTTTVTEEITTEEVVITEPPAPTRPYISDCTLSEDLQNYIFNLCNEYGVEYQFIMAIIKTESGFNTGAYNAGCVGLMQLNEYYNSSVASSLGVSLYDPYGNVLVGIRHVADLLSRYSYTDALICYNYGEWGAQGYLGGSTHYSRTVMSYYYDYVG